MNLPEIIADYLLTLKDSKKSVNFLICALIFCLTVCICEGFIIKNLQNKLENSSYEIKNLNDNSKRECLSLTYPPQRNNNYTKQKDYFSMQDLLNNNITAQTTTTIDLNDWISDSTDKWEDEINKNINLLKNVVNTKQYNLLQKSQQQWEEYKATELDFINDLFFSSSPGGNMWGSLFRLYELKLIENRAETLHSLYDDACFLQKIRKESQTN